MFGNIYLISTFDDSLKLSPMPRFYRQHGKCSKILCPIHLLVIRGVEPQTLHSLVSQGSKQAGGQWFGNIRWFIPAPSMDVIIPSMAVC